MRKNATKISIDLDNNIKEKIEKISVILEKKQGPLIEEMLAYMCDMPSSIRGDFETFISNSCSRYENILYFAGDVEKPRISEQLEEFKKFGALLNEGVEIEYVKPRKQIELKGGVLDIPSNWIVLNPEDAMKYEYCGVVECRNHEKYQIPHFCFFTKYRYGHQYTEEFFKYINELCCVAWPEFKKVQEMQVKAIPDPDNPGMYINGEEFNRAPTIGYFHILAEDDRYYRENPPYGAVVKRK